MYGTVARMRVKPENRQAMSDAAAAQMADPIDGFIGSHVLSENDSDTQWLFVIFRDRESYDRNADSPEQNDRYMQLRALMEDDPDWHDGVIETM